MKKLIAGLILVPLWTTGLVLSLVPFLVVQSFAAGWLTWKELLEKAASWTE